MPYLLVCRERLGMATELENLVMMAMGTRTDGLVVASVLNTGVSPVRARFSFCGLDRVSSVEGSKPVAEFLPVTWGRLGSKELLLAPGALQTSSPFVLDSTRSHFVLYGNGVNLSSCDCEVRRVGVEG